MREKGRNEDILTLPLQYISVGNASIYESVGEVYLLAQVGSGLQIGKDLYSLDEWLDESLGKEGTPEREKNRERAWEGYNALRIFHFYSWRDFTAFCIGRSKILAYMIICEN